MDGNENDKLLPVIVVTGSKKCLAHGNSPTLGKRSGSEPVAIIANNPLKFN